MKAKWYGAALFAATLAITGFSTGSVAYAATGESWQAIWPWDQPPAEFREVERQGFRDGVDGARKDYDHHRFPNVENRSEYRHPHMDASLREDYRRGFRRGYDDAMRHLMQPEEHRWGR